MKRCSPAAGAAGVGAGRLHPRAVLLATRFTLLLGAALFSFAPAGFAGAADSRPPNVVWINCEDIDPILSAYGDPLAHTPNLDRLAASGITYLNAFANAPICSPARAALATGLHPVSFGAQHLRCEVTLPESIKPLPVLLRDAGYFTSNFGKTDTNFDPDGMYEYWRQDLVPWRQRGDDRPFFSFFVLGATHEGAANLADRHERVTEGLPDELRVDPDQVTVPPYFPDTPEMRRILAGYYDLVSVLDLQVGEILDQLEADGLLEDTVIWFFSDHGHGLPRHKRWLLDSGLRVPLLVRVPERYRQLADGLEPGARAQRLVSFVDFAPTVLQLAGLDVPQTMHGRPFLGQEPAPPRDHVFATRDRADDMFELSRAVHDGRFIYVRHYMPHLPWIQHSRITSDAKASFAELRRARDAGELDQVQARLWAATKPVEELYDLEHDPYETRNLAFDPAYAARVERMSGVLRQWSLERRDLGFLPEAEAHLRAQAAEVTLYELAHDPDLYAIKEVMEAADEASRGGSSDRLIELLEDDDSGVRYWGAVGVQCQSATGPGVFAKLARALGDDSPSVAIAAAEAMCHAGRPLAALGILGHQLGGFQPDDDWHGGQPWVRLQAARALANIGEDARVYARIIAGARATLEGGDHPTRRYRDFNYASFTGWALEAALVGLGVAEWEDF